MRSILMFLAIFALAGQVPAAAQGGKAEPNRVRLAPGQTTKTLTGSLSTGQEMEYVFTAVKGQTVTIKNARTSLFDFRVFSDEFDVETEFESSPVLSLAIPETGDYMFFVRKKAVRTPRTARFRVTLTIK